MKFVVSSTALLNVLQTSNKVVSNKNTLPILDNFLFELKDGVLKITASDLETTMIGTLKVDSMEQEGVIAAPVKLMIDSLKEFSEQPLTIEANESTWEIQISWKTGKLAIPGTSGLSYPTQPALDEETKQEISVDTNLLLTGINKTIFATADDELRPVMNGVYVNIEPQAITFVATDAHKLVKYAASAETGTTASFILPKKPANLLRGVLGKEDADIRMEFDDKNVVFHLKNHTLVCRLIEGNYPNYNAVIPANNPNKVLVDRTELLNGIRRVAVCSNQATNLIKFEIEPEYDQPDRSGPRFLGVGSGIAHVRLRGRGDRDRLPVDLPCRDTLEHRDAERIGRAGRLDARRRVQARLRRGSGHRDADAAHADDDQRIKSVQDPSQAADRSAFAGTSAR